MRIERCIPCLLPASCANCIGVGRTVTLVGAGLVDGTVAYFGGEAVALGECDEDGLQCQCHVPRRDTSGYVDLRLVHPAGRAFAFDVQFFYATRCVAAGTMLTASGDCVDCPEGVAVVVGWRCGALLA